MSKSEDESGVRDVPVSSDPGVRGVPVSSDFGVRGVPVSSDFDEIEPIFRFLCKCTAYKPDDANFMRSILRAAHVILTTPSRGDELMEMAKHHLAIPDEMVALKQKSQDYLMADVWRFIESCEQSASAAENERAASLMKQFESLRMPIK